MNIGAFGDNKKTVQELVLNAYFILTCRKSKKISVRQRVLHLIPKIHVRLWILATHLNESDFSTKNINKKH